MEQIKVMLKAMEKNTAFSEEMRAVGKGGNVGEIIEAAAKKGFVFTEADWHEYMDWIRTQHSNLESKKLSPEELEHVAGGSATRNRYESAVCSTISEPCDRCTGVWDWGMWCDHYSRKVLEINKGMEKVRYSCEMGRYSKEEIEGSSKYMP